MYLCADKQIVANGLRNNAEPRRREWRWERLSLRLLRKKTSRRPFIPNLPTNIAAALNFLSPLYAGEIGFVSREEACTCTTRGNVYTCSPMRPRTYIQRIYRARSAVLAQDNRDKRPVIRRHWNEDILTNYPDEQCRRSISNCAALDPSRLLRRLLWSPARTQHGREIRRRRP